MPSCFKRQFRVRQYECDAYGHVNNANYIRWMQETALDASAAVGWDMERYLKEGFLWLVRDTEIEYFAPAFYQDLIEVKTWVEDFRKVRSLRIYEFYEVKTQRLLAKASTDWIFLAQESLRPVTIPNEVILAYMPEGQTNPSCARQKFPSPPATPAAEPFQYRCRVAWRDVDTMKHLNNAAYFNYFEDASTQVGRHFQWPMERMIDQGFAMIARKIRLNYQQPARMDDELEIRTYLYDPRRVMVKRHYEMRRVADETLLARALVLWVCIHLESGQPMRMPADFAADFAPNLAPSISPSISG